MIEFALQRDRENKNDQLMSQARVEMALGLLKELKSAWHTVVTRFCIQSISTLQVSREAFLDAACFVGLQFVFVFLNMDAVELGKKCIYLQCT